MASKPEELARVTIDHRLAEAGWIVQHKNDLNLWAGRGVAMREAQLGPDAADYLLFVDQQAVGVVEAKPEGTTLTGVELQSAKYSLGVPTTFNVPIRPLPFLYESTGIETRFTNSRWNWTTSCAPTPSWSPSASTPGWPNSSQPAAASPPNSSAGSN